MEKSDKVIERVNSIKICSFSTENELVVDEQKEIYKEALFFDLEHYVYKKPICVGVFGCCYFDEVDSSLKITQYMIEDCLDAADILKLAEEYFIKMARKYNKKYIVTFSGNNDFFVIEYLLKKNNININLREQFKEVDLQKEYERVLKSGIGLKNLEKLFQIERGSQLISGSNLAKTFGKIMKDSGYFKRMPVCKKEKILLYNEQDVVSLFYIMVNWNKYINQEIDRKINEEITQEE